MRGVAFVLKMKFRKFNRDTVSHFSYTERTISQNQEKIDKVYVTRKILKTFSKIKF